MIEVVVTNTFFGICPETGLPIDLVKEENFDKENPVYDFTVWYFHRMDDMTLLGGQTVRWVWRQTSCLATVQLALEMFERYMSHWRAYVKQRGPIVSWIKEGF